MTKGKEINFYGLFGPSFGDFKPGEDLKKISNPKQLALKALSCMHNLMSLNIKVALLTPHERPFTPFLRAIGHSGTDEDILFKILKEDPELLKKISSISCLKAANAATMSPSSDSEDRKVHFTPANMITDFSRSFEASMTGKILHRIFNNPNLFIHHFPLPPQYDYADRGAANHLRFCKNLGDSGLHFFAFNHHSTDRQTSKSNLLNMQSEQASAAIARLHRLNREKTIFCLINQDYAKDTLQALSNQNVILYHEKAFTDRDQVIGEIREKVEKHCQTAMNFIEIKQSQIPIEEAIKTNFFNSQLISKQDGSMTLIVSHECRNSGSVNSFIDELTKNTLQPINNFVYLNFGESLQSDCGPDSFRFRVILNPEEMKAMNPFVMLTPSLYQNLVEWVNKHFRDSLVLSDLADPHFLVENRQALDELTWMLQLGSLYSFQHQ